MADKFMQNIKEMEEELINFNKEAEGRDELLLQLS